MTQIGELKDDWGGLEMPKVKPSVDASLLRHSDLLQDEFWRKIPAYTHLSAAEFHDHRFQSRNSVTSLVKLQNAVGDLVGPEFFQDVAAGIQHSTMSLRVTPYIISLIDWQNALNDPLRIQFVPVGSRMQPDHPELTLDSLNEQVDSPVPGLTHRYFDRALFLALDTCPVYCRFCTRSYAVGMDTDDVEKMHFGVNTQRWEQVFAYIASRPELEDIVISGGDMFNLRAEHIKQIGTTLLAMDNIRRMRFATKGPAIMPQKLLTDKAWFEALGQVVEQGRKMHKDVVLHTHFNHPNEITHITRQALDLCKERGIVVRNQTVLQHGVNDDVETMRLLVRRLGYINIQPYYVFLHDMVKGVEDLRTTLGAAIDLEKQVRGITSGFNTPTFVLDTMGGGGKRNVHSHEYYDRENGIAVFTSPAVKPGEFFFYLDPLAQLDPEAVKRWSDADKRREMLATAVQIARDN